MVTELLNLGGAWWLLAQAKTQPAIRQMDAPTKVKVLAALAGFIILGFGLVALAYLGARVTRRYMNQGSHHGRSWSQLQDDWASTPLHPPQKTFLDDVSNHPDHENENDSDDEDR